MKALLFLGLSLPLLKATSLTCYTQDFTADYSFDSTNIFISSEVGSSPCWRYDACGLAKYDIDLTITTNSTSTIARYIEYILGLNKITTSYSVSAEDCIYNDTCVKLTGGTDKCRTTQIQFDTWVPTSCDNATNYDAIVYKYNSTYTYGCCTSDTCNDASSFDYSACETDQSFTNYMTGLYNCWGDEKKAFMKYLYCEGGRSSYDVVSNCYVKGSYDWTNATCRYKWTCDSEVQSILTTFGNCACAAAKDNGYSGVLVADFLESQWNTYCPSIDLTCSSSDSLNVYLTYYYVNYTIYLNLPAIEVDEIIQAAIRTGVADATYVNESLVVITSVKDGNVTDTSEIIVTISLQTSSDQLTVQSNCQSNGNTQVQQQTGYTVLSSSTSTSSYTLQVYGSSSNSTSTSGNTSSSNSYIGRKIEFFVVVMVLIFVCLLF